MITFCNSCCCAIDLKTLSGEEGIFSGTAGKALDGVSFNLERGKTLAVVGSPLVENPHWVAC